jgi:hypothetical protein
LIGAATVLLVIGVVTTGCSSSDDSQPPAPADTAASPGAPATASGAAALLKQAAANTKSAQTARIRLDGAIDAGSQSISSRGEGVADFASGDAELTLSADVGGQPQELTVRIVDGTTYMQMPLLGDVWLRSPQPLGAVTGANPESLLNAIGSVSNLEAVGEEDVDGVSATHYTGSIDIAEAVAAAGAKGQQAKQMLALLKGGTGTSAIDVWVDDEDRVIKVNQSLDLDVKGEQRGQSTSISFSDFGTDVDVQAPDPAKIMDADQLPGAVGGAPQAG